MLLPVGAESLSIAQVSPHPWERRHEINEFVERTKPDELMVTAQVYDHPARLRSFELLMQAVSQPSPALAK